jgi:putative methanogenesis marker protein 12
MGFRGQEGYSNAGEKLVRADLMFLGVDHGTTAIRFATTDNQCWEISRRTASRLLPSEIIAEVCKNLDVSRVDMVALTYSMGDGINRIMRLEDAPNRGLIQLDGAGVHQGGGTRVFEAIAGSGWPVILLPGIHRQSDIDPRLKVFSHGMSPEKVGLAYGIYKKGVQDFIVCDASSNTVTFCVLQGKIVGAIDAPIFAPGLMQGPLDVEAIRAVDAGRMTANQAFTCGGIVNKMGYRTLEECSPDERNLAIESLALFAAMEINAMLVLSRDLGKANPTVFLAGSPARLLEARVSELLGKEARTLGKCAAASGCAAVAEDVFEGCKNILGLEVDMRARTTGARLCAH